MSREIECTFLVPEEIAERCRPLLEAATRNVNSRRFGKLRSQYRVIHYSIGPWFIEGDVYTQVRVVLIQCSRFQRAKVIGPIMYWQDGSYEQNREASWMSIQRYGKMDYRKLFRILNRYSSKRTKGV